MDIREKPEGAAIVWHGSYGEWTYYDIVRHCYGCTDCEAEHQGYVEVLEIKNAPPWRSKYVIHEYWASTGSNVYEFPSLEAALSAFPKWIGSSGPRDIPEFGSTGYIRSLYYGQKRPWFYIEP